jgi:hypothetical protein
MTAKPPNRPCALPVQFDHIPLELANRPRWVVWRYEFRKGKWTKPPFTPDGRNASSTDKTTWSSFATVRVAYEAGGWDGVGFIHLPEDNLTGGDADKCRDPQTGALTGADAAALLELNTYTEVSPSATGIRAYAFGRKPGRKAKKGRFELYDGITAADSPGGRYLTLTGHRLENAPETIQERQTVINAIYSRYWPNGNGKPTGNGKAHAGSATPDCPIPLDDKERDRWNRLSDGTRLRTAALWGGDTSSYGNDDSLADAALCKYLAVLTDGDQDRIERLMGQSGLGRREKWTERPDYRKRTIEFVLQDFQSWASASTQTKSPPPESPPVVTPAAPSARLGWEIIRDHFLQHYRPGFKNGDAIYSGAELREVRRVEACASLPPGLIKPLILATDVPRYATGDPKGPDAMPGFFKKWAGTAWAGLLADLPDEDAADLGGAATELAAEEFRRLVREALLTPIVLGQNVQIGSGPDAHFETKLEKIPLANWCQRFAKPGQWKSVRDLKVWCKTAQNDAGELVYRIAIRHEMFAQIKADRRLSDMGSNRFTRRAERYGVGKPGGQSDRPHGKWALVLADGFVADLIGTADVEGDEADGSDDDICTPSDSSSSDVQ